MNLPLKVWFGFSMTTILPIVQCPRLWETTALSVYYRCKDTTPGCCSSDWLTQLQQSWCPLLKLLILVLVTLPIYNVLLILVGWRFQSSIRSSPEQHLKLSTRPVKYPAPQPPIVPPKPPPRVRRRPAVTSPMRPSTSESVPYSSQMNPFTDQEPYQILRRNLQLVLMGLQNPSLELVPPRVPESNMKPFGKTVGIPPGKPDGIPREIPSEITSDVVSLCPSEYPRSEAKKKRSKVIFKRIWQKWRSRNKLKKTKKSLVSVSSSSCSSTNASSCFYI